MSLDQTVVGRCVVVVDTLHATLRFTIAASASITGAAMSSVRAAPSSCRSTDAAERRYIHQQLEQNWLIVWMSVTEDTQDVVVNFVALY